jgi:hypothetical protein
MACNKDPRDGRPNPKHPSRRRLLLPPFAALMADRFKRECGRGDRNSEVV